MNIQWFPGHMTKAVRMMEENLSMCDVCLYVIDSRAVNSSINPVLNKLVQNKRVIYLFNKCDLVEKTELDKWVSKFSREGKICSATVGTGDLSKITSLIKTTYKDVLDKYLEKGVKKHVRAMIVGIPNSGKSTIINSMRKKASAVTGDKAGVTRGKQWLAIDSFIDLLDTPGTLWGKFEDETVAKHLAYIGAINDDILDKAELALEFISEIVGLYPSALKTRYGVDETLLPLDILNGIALSRGFKMRGGEVDYDRCALAVIDDFRKGRLGKIMLEKL
ncbi:ribosome biogenesis GTPase A [Acidaminococcus sp. CAG:917]|nr:ribosome biogenesis GTPase A [Acidaminococcus sp. CAG:917]